MNLRLCSNKSQKKNSGWYPKNSTGGTSPADLSPLLLHTFQCAHKLNPEVQGTLKNRGPAVQGIVTQGVCGKKPVEVLFLHEQVILFIHVAP